MTTDQSCAKYESAQAAKRWRAEKERALRTTRLIERYDVTITLCATVFITIHGVRAPACQPNASAPEPVQQFEHPPSSLFIAFADATPFSSPSFRATGIQASCRQRVARSAEHAVEMVGSWFSVMSFGGEG